MDLSSVNNLKKSENNSQVAFQGRMTTKNEEGSEKETFYIPYVNLKKDEKLGIEFVPLKRNGVQYVLPENAKPIKYSSQSQEYKDFEEGRSTHVSIDISGLKKHTGEYGYRYVVYNQDGDRVKSFTDGAGTKIESEELGSFTVASTRQGTPAVGGSMMHIFQDSYNVKGLKNFQRTHVNKAGGTIQGIVEKIDEDDELKPYRYIMTTPLIGGGAVSSHMYHPANHFQVSEGTGTKQDFMDLQVACFNKGKGYVLDGAFTSQGYEGLQFNHALKHPDSPFKYWFKNPGKDGYSLGVLSDNKEADKYTGIRIVNPKHSADYNYDPTMPTYIQFYDTRLASDDQVQDKGKLIKSYDIKNTEDPYEITTWHDATLCNFFEIDPDCPTLKGKTEGSLQEWEDSGLLNKILSPNGQPYNFERRGKVAGTTGWDGNIDLVKMNLSNPVSNNKNLVEGSKQARNQMYNVARYWTEETRNALIMNVAENLHNKKSGELNRYLNTIEQNFSLEKGSLSTISDSINNGSSNKGYNCKIVNDSRGGNEIIQEGILNFPMESLNFSPELLGVLSTPYITPRPTATEKAEDSRLDIFKKLKTDKDSELSETMREVYSESIPSFVREILYNIQTKSGNKIKLFEANGDNIGTLTPQGKYFVKMAMDDIMNFAISTALFGEDGAPEYKNGKADFTSKDNETEGNGKRLSLKKLNVYESSAQREAEAVAKKIKKGIEKAKTTESFSEFEEYLTNRYANMSTEEYKTAEAIVDKTGAGLNWRFDAAKDVGDFEETREGQISPENVWDDVISFWKPFVKNVRNNNNSSYIVAEVTSLWNYSNLPWGKYENPDKAEAIFYEETGATTGSNYSTFFGAYPKLFGKNIEEGAVQNFRSMHSFRNAAKNFCMPHDSKGHMSSEFILNSHVFLDNHDKPRAAHLMGVDPALFWGDFKNIADRKKAKKILERPYEDRMSSKAVAVAEKYLEYIDNISDEMGIKQDDKVILENAVRHLARGSSYTNVNDTSLSHRRAEAFGSLPFEITIPHVMDIADRMGLSINKKQEKEIENKLHENMVAPYESKMPAIYEMMAGTVGIPTLFAGDDLAQTGSETKSKNWALGCRDLVRHEWLKDPSKKHIQDFNTRIKQIGLLGNTKGMSALKNGTPIFVDAPKNQEKIYDYATKDEIIAGLQDVINNDKKYAMEEKGYLANTVEVCNFLNCVKEKTETDKNENGGEPVAVKELTEKEVLDELQSMTKEELAEKLKERMKNDPGKEGWVCDDLIFSHMATKPKTHEETGAVIKYNDKGSVVVSLMTNAFITETPKVGGLLNKGIEVANINSVKLLNYNGEKIAPEGAIVVKKEYDEKQGKYIDAGEYRYTKEGTLEAINGSKEKVDSTVTYFYKKQPESYRRA